MPVLAYFGDTDKFLCPADLWHIPGTRVLMGDTAVSALKERVMKRDFGFVLPREQKFLDARDILKGNELGWYTSTFGQEVYRAYYYTLDEDDPQIRETEALKFFPLDAVPEEFLLYQLPTVELLRDKFVV